MNTAAKAIKKAHKDMDVDQVHDMMDEIGKTIFDQEHSQQSFNHIKVV